MKEANAQTVKEETIEKKEVVAQQEIVQAQVTPQTPPRPISHCLETPTRQAIVQSSE